MTGKTRGRMSAHERAIREKLADAPRIAQASDP